MGRNCTTPGAPPTFVLTQTDRQYQGHSVDTVSIGFGIKNPRHPPPRDGARLVPEINGQINLTDVGDRRIHVSAKLDGFPSWEIYQDNLGGQTVTHLRQKEGAIVNLFAHLAPQRQYFDSYDYYYTNGDSRFFRALSGGYSIPQFLAYDPAALGLGADEDRRKRDADTAHA